MELTYCLGTFMYLNKCQNISYLSLLSEDQNISKTLGTDFSSKCLFPVIPMPFSTTEYHYHYYHFHYFKKFAFTAALSSPSKYSG